MTGCDKGRRKRRAHLRYRRLIKQELNSILKFGKSESPFQLYKFPNSIGLKASKKKIKLPFAIACNSEDSDACLVLDSFNCCLHEGKSCPVCKGYWRCSVDDDFFATIEGLKSDTNAMLSIFKAFPDLLRGCIRAAVGAYGDKNDKSELKQQIADIIVILCKKHTELLWGISTILDCVTDTHNSAFHRRKGYTREKSHLACVELKIEKCLIASVEIHLNSQFLHLCQTACRNLRLDQNLKVIVSRSTDHGTVNVGIQRQHSYSENTVLDRTSDFEMRALILKILQESMFC